jgi:hypothetical protein
VYEDVRALRPKLWAVGLLAGLAACGRLGYEGALTVDGSDGPIAARDAAADVVAPVDRRGPAPDANELPDAAAPDVRDVAATPEAFIPDPPDAFVFLDAGPPRDALEAPPPDAGPDAATTWTVVATGQNATTRRGATGGAGAIDLCPMGTVLIGLAGTQSPGSGAIRSVGGTCGSYRVPAGGGAPLLYLATARPLRGDTSGEQWLRICPTGYVVIGFDGNTADGVIGQLVLNCAAITVTPSGQVVYGAQTELDDVGAPTSTDFPQTDCPAGQAARGTDIRAGSALEGFGLICGTLTAR